MKCKARYLNEHDRPKIVRLVADAWPDVSPTNVLPAEMLSAALVAWPTELFSTYLITPGGFLTFEWPDNLFVKNVKHPTSYEIDYLNKGSFLSL